MTRLEQEPLRTHTTFRIGGPAVYYFIPEREEEIIEALDFAKEKGLSYYVIGKGSNMLFSDDGFDGVIIEIGKGLEKIEISDDGVVTAQAGVSLAYMASRLASKGLKGFAFAGGIPGTLGGGVAMNAGAYGGEMAQVVKEVTVLFPEDGVKTLSGEEMAFSYRHSLLTEHPDTVVLRATLHLQAGIPGEIREKMDELMARRKASQPLEYPSAGSTFKRPATGYAAAMIEAAGLKGLRVGDAQVSEKHCGFVINRGNATASDVMQLISDVKDKVKEQFGVTMEPEVKRVGRF